jgi:hypothetical protein
MNTLLQGPSRMPFYTDLRVIFDALDGHQTEFVWLLTDLVCSNYPPPLVPSGPLWMTGQQLTTLVTRYTIQFVWGVISGFPTQPMIRLDCAEDLPYADGNRALWQPGVTIQHPEAVAEIVCWDSTATLLLSKDTELTGRFRTFFPEAVDLDKYNEAHAADHTT